MRECVTPHRLLCYLNGQLPSTDSTSVEQHIDNCDRCRFELQNVLEENEALPPGFFNTEPETSQSASELPTIVGYKIIERLGSGGMGIVYSAVDLHSQQQVAIKIVNRRYDYALNLRFKRERRLLASVEHPNVARLYRVGTFDGSPFLVMELVQGLDLVSVCDRKKLTLPERLELFLQVCDATQHLHRKLIIHRDLKPSNILVSKVAGRLTAKLIDFGLAKLLAPEEATDTLPNSIVGTLAYMSPEQASGNVRTLDASTDIFSLGAILYELLTGDTPIGHSTIASLSNAETRQKIQDEEPVPPSIRLLAETDKATASQRPRLISRNDLTGDLDAIVTHALQKEPSNRYQSVADLAADIRRYLDNEPIQAVAPTLFCRCRKFAKKNATLVVFTSALLLSLVVGILSTTYWLLEAKAATKSAKATADRESQANDLANEMRAKERAARIEAEAATLVAERRRKKMQKASLLLRGFFNGLNPEIVDGGDGQLRGILVSRLKQSASEMVDEDLSEDEDVLLLKESLANSLIALGEASAAIPLWESMVKDVIALKGENTLDALSGILNLGVNYNRTSQLEKAKLQFEKARRIADRILPPDHLHSIIIDHYACSNLEKLGQLDASYERRKALVKCVPGTPETQALRNDLFNSLGLLQIKLGFYDEAVPSLNIAIAGLRKAYAQTHPLVLTSRGNLALAMGRTGDQEGAEREYREILQLRKRQFPRGSAPVASAQISLAAQLVLNEKPDQAKAIFDEVVKTASGIEFRFNAKVELAILKLRVPETAEEGLTNLEQLRVEIRKALGSQHRVYKLCQKNIDHWSKKLASPE